MLVAELCHSESREPRAKREHYGEVLAQNGLIGSSFKLVSDLSSGGGGCRCCCASQSADCLRAICSVWLSKQRRRFQE